MTRISLQSEGSEYFFPIDAVAQLILADRSPILPRLTNATATIDHELTAADVDRIKDLMISIRIKEIASQTVVDTPVGKPLAEWFRSKLSP